MAVTEKKTPWWKLWSPFTSEGGGVGGQVTKYIGDNVGGSFSSSIPGYWPLVGSLTRKNSAAPTSRRLPTHWRTKTTDAADTRTPYQKALDEITLNRSGTGAEDKLDLSATPISTAGFHNLLTQNDAQAASREARWQRLLNDSRSYQKGLPISQLMGMGPKDWADPEAIANERANLQYDPQIAEALLERKKMELQGKQNRSDIGGWYDLIDAAMTDARMGNIEQTKDISAFANDASKSLMQSLGGAANSANGAIAATAQSNNNMLATLGQVQGNYLQNSQLNAQLEGAQQQTNQMRLNDQADQLAAQQLAKLRGSKAASAADYRFTMEGQNKDLQSQRLATKAGLLGQNAEIQAGNLSRRLGFEQMLDQVGQDRLSGRRSLLGDISGAEKWNADHTLGVAKSNIEHENMLFNRGANTTSAVISSGQALLDQVIDADGNSLRGFKTVDEAWNYLEPRVKMLEEAGYTGIKEIVLRGLQTFKNK